jgi:hypothetical protein
MRALGTGPKRTVGIDEFGLAPGACWLTRHSETLALSNSGAEKKRGRLVEPAPGMLLFVILRLVLSC